MPFTVAYTPGGSPIQGINSMDAAALDGGGGTGGQTGTTPDDGQLPGIYYIDHLDHDQVVYQTIRPENLSFELVISDQDTVTYELSLSAKDILGFDAVYPDVVGPWRTGWQLRCGHEVISAGNHTTVGGAAGDDFMTIGGTSWEGYFNRRHQPFNPKDGHQNDFVIGSPPAGLHYEFLDESAATDISHIVKALFDCIFDLPNSLPITYPRLDVGFGIIHYSVSLGDFTYFMSMIQDLGDNTPGFDFWVEPDTLVLKLASPFRFGDTPAIIAEGPGGPNLAYTFDDTNLRQIGGSLEFTNTGPEKTHTVGSGSSISQGTVTGVALGTPNGNEKVFWRLDGTYDAGDQAIDEEVIEQMTRHDFGLGLQPVHEIPLSVDTATFGDSFWTRFKKGYAIWIQYNLGFHEIDSPQRIVSMSGKVDNEGNCTVDFGLDQIYYVDPNIGVIENGTGSGGTGGVGPPPGPPDTEAPSAPTGLVATPV